MRWAMPSTVAVSSAARTSGSRETVAAFGGEPAEEGAPTDEAGVSVGVGEPGRESRSDVDGVGEWESSEVVDMECCTTCWSEIR